MIERHTIGLTDHLSRDELIISVKELKIINKTPIGAH
jgi:hypothetical protein